MVPEVSHQPGMNGDLTLMADAFAQHYSCYAASCWVFPRIRLDGGGTGPYRWIDRLPHVLWTISHVSVACLP